MSDSFELGADLFKREPDLIKAAVWWRASKHSQILEKQFNFVSGYMSARRQRDDHEREKKAEALANDLEQLDTRTGV